MPLRTPALLSLLLVVLSGFKARAEEFGAPSVFEHGARSAKVVALTFDACSTKENGYDPRIIETLRTTQTPATLFLGGFWMEAHRALVRQLAQSPLFELASHSYTHPHLDQLSPEKLERQIDLAQKTFVHLTGRPAALFRPPFGDLNTSVVEAAWRHKLRTVTWDLPSGDPDPQLSLENLVQRTIRSTKPGSIVVLHMNGRGIHTAEALPLIIAGLKERGFSFVTVGKLLETEGKQAPVQVAEPAPERK